MSGLKLAASFAMPTHSDILDNCAIVSRLFCHRKLNPVPSVQNCVHNWRVMHSNCCRAHADEGSDGDRPSSRVESPRKLAPRTGTASGYIDVVTFHADSNPDSLKAILSDMMRQPRVCTVNVTSDWTYTVSVYRILGC